MYTGARKDKREKICKKICIFRRHCEHATVREQKKNCFNHLICISQFTTIKKELAFQALALCQGGSLSFFFGLTKG